MSQKRRKKNAKVDDKSKSVYFSWSDDEVQLLLNVTSAVARPKNLGGANIFWENKISEVDFIHFYEN